LKLAKEAIQMGVEEGRENMDASGKKVPDILKALGTVIATFVAIWALTFGLEFVFGLLLRFASYTTRTTITASLPQLVMLLFGLTATYLSVSSIRQYDALSRIVGGALAGYVGASVALYPNPKANLFVAAAIVALVSASVGKTRKDSSTAAPAVTRPQSTP